MAGLFLAHVYRIGKLYRLGYGVKLNKEEKLAVVLLIVLGVAGVVALATQ